VRLRLISCLLLAACASRVATPEVDDVATCGGSYTPPAGWREIVVDPGPTALRVPGHYWEQRHQVVQRANIATLHGRSSQMLSVQEAAGPATLDSAVMYREDGLAGYSVCRDTVRGRPAIVQLLRGRSRVRIDEKLQPSFDMRVTIALDSGRYLHIHGINNSQAGRREQLLIARTARIFIP